MLPVSASNGPLTEQEYDGFMVLYGAMFSGHSDNQMKGLTHMSGHYFCQNSVNRGELVKIAVLLPVKPQNSLCSSLMKLYSENLRKHIFYVGGNAHYCDIKIDFTMRGEFTIEHFKDNLLCAAACEQTAWQIYLTDLCQC